MTATILILVLCILSAGIAPWCVYARLGRINDHLQALEHEVALITYVDGGFDDDPDGGIPADEGRSNVVRLEARAA